MSRRRVLITGAGSGTGAATAKVLAPTHDVVLAGRRRERLDDVAAAISAEGGTASVQLWDATTDPASALLSQTGTITDIVYAAGLNTPRRTWETHVDEEFRRVIDTNLTAIADLVAAALPMLRTSRGSVIVVSSLSAWMTSPGAGVAYRASKMAVRALSESLNEQEAVHGVRASIVLPGDIDSEFLSLRPNPPASASRQKMLAPEDVAAAIAFALNAPPHLRIDELVVTPLGTVDRERGTLGG